MTTQKYYSGSKTPSKRHSESRKPNAKNAKHIDTIALKRAAKRGVADKTNTKGYGWGGGPGRARWRMQLRRDESSKRTDAQRSRSFKR